MKLYRKIAERLWDLEHNHLAKENLKFFKNKKVIELLHEEMRFLDEIRDLARELREGETK